MELSIMGSANPNQYSSLRHLGSDGTIRRTLSAHLESQLKAYLTEHYRDHLTVESFPDIPLQKALFAITQNHQAPLHHRELAEQCLRCRISHTIFQTIDSLWDKFGKSVNPFSLIEILSLVLNDTDRHLRPFSPIDPSAPTQFKPLAQKILETYNPKSASLNTWTSRLTRHDPEIVRFLLEHGIAQISHWALLNECTPSRLERLLKKEYGIEGGDRDKPQYKADFQKIDHDCDLLQQFHLIYTQTRTPGSPCQIPTKEQFKAIADSLHQSPKTCKEELLKLAKILRNHYIRSRGGRVPQKEINYDDIKPSDEIIDEERGNSSKSKNSLNIDWEDLSTDLLDDSELFENTQKLHTILLTRCQTSFPIALELAVEQAIEQRYQTLLSSSHTKTREKAKKLYFPALHCVFCEFQKMKDIAAQLGMARQEDISNLLELTPMRSTVRRLTLQIMLTDLKQAMKSFPLQTLEDLDHAIAQIDRWISVPDDPQIDTSLINEIAKPIDQLIKEESARAMNSVNPRQPNQYTQAVCKYVTSQKIKEMQHST
jgi:hypothetical protein